MEKNHDGISTLQASFRTPGAYALVDGQFGSTGKGLLAAYLATHINTIDWVFSNAGPNSGHTSYFGDEKIVLKQLPTFGVIRQRMGKPVRIWLSHGAMINKDILQEELRKYVPLPETICLSPRAGRIRFTDVVNEGTGSIHQTATTGQGGGANLARKVLRDPSAVVGHDCGIKGVAVGVPNVDFRRHRVLLEVSQGYSLGLNQRFYPKVTSRECTAAQAFSDAGISPRHFAGCVMTLRTYPIRVGNLGEVSSGGHYEDQVETSWEEIGQEPELTTVTKRIRRVFTFSWQQFREACAANTPNILFLNFCNYLRDSEVDVMVDRLLVEATAVLGFTPMLILGYGPKVEDCKIV